VKRKQKERGISSPPLFTTLLSVSFFLALPAVVIPFQPKPVHRLGCLRLYAQYSSLYPVRNPKDFRAPEFLPENTGVLGSLR